MTQEELRSQQSRLAGRQQDLARVQREVSGGVSSVGSSAVVSEKMDDRLLSADELRSFRDASRVDIEKRLESQVRAAQAQAAALFRTGGRREARQAQEIAAQTGRLLADIRSGKGRLSSQELVRIAKARFPTKRFPDLEAKFGFDENAVRARAGVREKELLMRARDDAGFRGGLREFRDTARQMSKEALRKVGVSQRLLFLAGGQSRVASSEQVLQAQRELLRQGGASVSVDGRRAGVVGSTLFVVQKPSSKVDGGGVRGESGVVDSGSVAGSVTGSVVGSLARKKPTTRLEKFEKRVEEFKADEKVADESGFVQGVTRFAERGAEFLTSKTPKRSGIQLNVLGGESPQPEGFAFGQPTKSNTRVLLKGALSAPLLFVDTAKATRKTGLALEGLSIPETRSSVSGELLRSAKEVEKNELSFLPETRFTPTPINQAGEVTLTAALLGGLAGRRGVSLDAAASDVTSGAGVLLRSTSGKRGTAGRKPLSKAEKSKIARGQVKVDTFSRDARLRKKAVNILRNENRPPPVKIIDVQQRGTRLEVRRGELTAREASRFRQSQTRAGIGGGVRATPGDFLVVERGRGGGLSKRQARRERGKQKASSQQQFLKQIPATKQEGVKQSVSGKRVVGVGKQLGFERSPLNLPARGGAVQSGVGKSQFSDLSGRRGRAVFVPPPEFVSYRVDPVTGLLVEKQAGGFRPGMRERLSRRLEEKRDSVRRDAELLASKPVVGVKARVRVKPKVVELLKRDSRVTPRLGVGLASGLVAGQRSAQAQAQAQDLAQLPAQDSLFADDVVASQRRAFDFDSPPRPPRSPPRTRPPPRRPVTELLRPRPSRRPPRSPPRRIPKVPVPKFGLDAGRGQVSFNKKDLVDAFLVEIKRRGKFVTLASGVSKSEALRLGSQQTLSELAATFRVRKSGGRVERRRDSGLPDLSSFREFRIRKGQRIATPGTFVQKRGERLKTRREVSLLQASRKGRGGFL